MVKKFFTYFFLVLFIFIPDVFLQDQGVINKEKKELNKIQSEINNLEKELKKKTKKEKETIQDLENYNKQSFLINSLINKLRSEEELTSAEIDSLQNNIKFLEQRIKELQDNYAKYVVSIYKYGKVNHLNLLFNSKSINQSILRYKYLQIFSNQREKDLDNFVESKNKLSNYKNKLAIEKQNKIYLVAQKENEEELLQAKLSERKKIVKSLRNDKESLRKELLLKKQAEASIQNMIANLIEIEKRKKLEKLKTSNSKKNEIVKNDKKLLDKKNNDRVNNDDVEISSLNLSTFAGLKGRMKWPLSGSIVKRFGENRNNQLNTVTINNGIDIKAGNQLEVKSVADGVVSVIEWIVGFGSVIIVTHKDGFRTVYSHVAEIYVKEGDRISGGQTIGKVGESLQGNILHFEIWNERFNQNPEVWLGSK
ncbi:MAG TPA: peptidoglycan DD-metalloendopeptidase family protein [Ignavibacteriaceae bacterium]|nr:peptidoglycan DD-metalloendopeptidase family protein [Ignavibacteriaceae bacterium]